MKKSWLNFRIDIGSLYEFIDINLYDKHDGIICDEDQFEIVEKIEFTEDELTLINNHINSLNENDELVKLNLTKYFNDYLMRYKEIILLKDITEYTVLDKKVLFNLELTKLDKQSIVDILNSEGQ